MNVRASLIMNESIDRENRGREGWMATHGKEMGLDKIAVSPALSLLTLVAYR